MGLVAYIIIIYVGGPIGLLCLFISLVQFVRKKESAKIWFLSGAIITAIAGFMFSELLKVNFGL